MEVAFPDGTSLHVDIIHAVETVPETMLGDGLHIDSDGVHFTTQDRCFQITPWLWTEFWSEHSHLSVEGPAAVMRAYNLWVKEISLRLALEDVRAGRFTLDELCGIFPEALDDPRMQAEYTTRGNAHKPRRRPRGICSNPERIGRVNVLLDGQGLSLREATRRVFGEQAGL